MNRKAPALMVGDRVIWLDPDHEIWEGIVTASRIAEPTVVVKLDYGGTFTVPRNELRPIQKGTS